VNTVQKYMRITVCSDLVEALGRLAADRDREAWGYVLEQVGPDIQRMAARLTGDSSMADDAIQETLLQIRDHAGRFIAPGMDGDAAARRWILAIAAHVSGNLVRTRQRRRRRESIGTRTVGTQTLPEDKCEQDEQVAHVRMALAQLPERQRSAIVLHHLAGLQFAEVASALRCPIGTAKTNVRRGLETLRQQLLRSGVVVTTAALITLIEQLPAADISSDISAFTCLLTAPVKAAALTSFSHLGAFIMASKIAVVTAGLLAAITAPFLFTEDSGDQNVVKVFPTGKDVHELRKPSKTVAEFLGDSSVRIIAQTTKVDIYRIESFQQKVSNVLRDSIDNFPIIAVSTEATDEARTLLPQILFNHATYDFRTAKGCEFMPGVAFRIWSGQQHVDVLVCFSCDELSVVNYEKSEVIRSREDCDAARPQLLALAKAAFPHDEKIQALK
jgi:RNA polymerase sigma-70 factor, ECF subfamily